jgi:hypothetical protein
VAVLSLRPRLPRVLGLLLRAEVVYAHQGYCAAIASLPDRQGLEALTAYLDERLVPGGDRHHDQPWIMATLMHVDRELGTSASADLLAPGGPWEQWAGGSGESFLRAGTSWLDDALNLVAMCQQRVRHDAP